jgi:lipopolysaccharide biosynthesis protein
MFVARVTRRPGAFPANGKRVIFYLFHDSRGEVDDFVLYKLRELRPYADHIFVVVNGRLVPDAAAELQIVADTVWERENVGYDVWGYKSALAEFGSDRLAEYDELILMNYTWFGPVRPFAPVFERMDAQELDFWGMTAHGGATPNPFTGKGVMHEHIQSHWIAARRSLFQTDAWRDYWRDMPMITNYTESVLNHESRFTRHFIDKGFTAEVAFPLSDYPTQHPALLNPDQLMDDGCPVLKRRVFFHYPPFMDRNAVIGRWTARKAEAYGYPMPMLWQNLSRTVPPKTLNVNAGMLEVLPDVDVSYDPSRSPRIAAIVHIFYEEMTDELVDRLEMLPTEYDLYITTTDEGKARIIIDALARRTEKKFQHVEVRVLESNRGRDLSAFFIGCRDVLRSGAYDLIVKLHSKKTVQQSFNAGRMFARQQIDDVLNSPGYAANAIALFQKEPGLGVVFPPMIHIGFPTMGRGWFANRGPTEKLAKKLNIRVPMDEVSPLAPFGCMWIARPEALKILTDVDWTYEQYSPPAEHRDGSLAHVQERIIAYAAGELGFHCRTIASFEQAAISHTSMDYKLDQMSSTTPGYALEQIQLLHKAGWIGSGGVLTMARMYMRVQRPKTTKALFPIFRIVRHALYGARGLRRRFAEESPVEDLGVSDRAEMGSVS